MLEKIFSKFAEFGGIRGIFKTIFLNFQLFPCLQAVKFPVWISGKSKISKYKKGSIKIIGKPMPGMLRIGVHSHIFCPYSTTLVFIGGEIIIHSGSRILIESNCFIGVGPNSILEIKGDFQLGSGSRIVCHNHISIGNNNIWHENVYVYDHETYEYYDNRGQLINEPMSISIGENIWIQPSVRISKGTVIPDNSIIEMGSFCNSTLNTLFSHDNGYVISGVPASIVNKNIHNSWKVNFKPAF